MAVDINITKKLDNNFVQVEVESKNVPKRFFKVPESKVDEFCKSYKEYNKKQSFLSSLRVATPAVLACAITNQLTQKLGTMTRWASSIGVGILTLIGSTYLNTKHVINKEDELLQKYEAIEFDDKPRRMEFLYKSK